jgi:hypothetical protein
MDSSDWSNRIRYHIFDTRPDTEFKRHHVTWRAIASRTYRSLGPAHSTSSDSWRSSSSEHSFSASGSPSSRQAPEANTRPVFGLS